MPTFLSFRRAVKAHAESLCVYAVVFSAGCASAAIPRAVPGASTGPVRGNPTSTPAEIGDAPPALDARAAPPEKDEPAVEPSTLSAGVALAFEEPYPLAAPPRASNTRQAAANDEDLARWNFGGTADPNYISSQASFHPGTRVVVDTYFAGHRKPTSAHGRGLSAERVQTQARSKGYWPFRLCFEAGQREKKGLGGETLVRFTIGRRGTVTAARVVSSELRNSATIACLLGELRKLRFEPRPARARSVVSSIRIWPGDVELPRLSDAPAAPTESASDFDPDAVRARLVAKEPELTACFSEARRRDPNLWGRLALSVVLEVDGSVHRVNEIESHFPNATAARCAAAIVAGVTFPSVQGKPFSFVAALRLAPLGKPQPNPASIQSGVSAPPETEGGADASD